MLHIIRCWSKFTRRRCVRCSVLPQNNIPHLDTHALVVKFGLVVVLPPYTNQDNKPADNPVIALSIACSPEKDNMAGQSTELQQDMSLATNRWRVREGLQAGLSTKISSEKCRWSFFGGRFHDDSVSRETKRRFPYCFAFYVRNVIVIHHQPDCRVSTAVTGTKNTDWCRRNLTRVEAFIFRSQIPNILTLAGCGRFTVHAISRGG